MNALAAFFAACAAFFGWRQKVDRTPDQSEKQKIRSETDQAHDQVDDVVDRGLPPR